MPGVPRAKTVVLALGAEGKAIQAVGLADGVKTVFAPGQEFVDIDLVAHVPDEFVFRGGEHVVQGEGEFHHAEIRAEMAARLGEAGDQLLPDFAGELFELGRREFLHVRRSVHHVQVSVHNHSSANSTGNGFKCSSPAAVFSNC